jgi:CRP/FNR family cyclic AMP-dependent transcriptional regulator
MKKHSALIDALKEHKIVAGNQELASQIAATGELVDVPAGTPVIEQGSDDNEVYLVTAGSFDIAVNGQVIARRVQGDHFGEMALLLPMQRRAASVTAHENSTVVRLSGQQLTDLASRFPQIWRCFALELAHRLLQRNTVATGVSEKLRLLLISSAAASPIAKVIQKAFEPDGFEIAAWTEGSFRHSRYAVENLEQRLDQTDVAIAIAEPEESGGSAGHAKGAPHDNVIFELGFFMGRLGRHRTFLIEPRGEELKLPAGLAGINVITWKYGDDLEAALTPACKKLRTALGELGPKR